jgi:hypothetical protein
MAISAIDQQVTASSGCCIGQAWTAAAGFGPPNSVRHADVLPIDSAAQLRILDSVNTYVSGAVLREAQELRAHQAERQAEADFQGDIQAERADWRNRLDATGLFPRFVRFLDLGIDPDAPETIDARFEFGLDCLLSGIAARLST